MSKKSNKIYKINYNIDINKCDCYNLITKHYSKLKGAKQ